MRQHSTLEKRYAGYYSQLYRVHLWLDLVPFQCPLKFYSMRILLFFLVSLLLPHLARTTGDSLQYLLPSDSIIIDVEYNTLLHGHRLEAKQTLYSLARFYGLSLEELYAFNPSIRFGNYAIGNHIRIPIPYQAIRLEPPLHFLRHRYAPVFYRVRRGDTVFSICRRYFGIDINLLRQRNYLSSDALEPGRLLFIGWLSTQGISPELQAASMGPYERMNLPYKQQFLRQNQSSQLEEERGKAAWNEAGGNDFFALHRTAPINSIIEVINPMNQKKCYLKVVGRVPDQVYDRNTVVVVSLLVVKALSARDDRFYVHVKHARS